LWRKTIFMGAVLLAATFGTVSDSHAMYYWDTNGSSPGAGATPDGTWAADATWNETVDGSGETIPWSDDVHAAFSAGDDATSAYTARGGGTNNIADIHPDNGGPTLVGCSLALTG